MNIVIIGFLSALLFILIRDIMHDRRIQKIAGEMLVDIGETNDLRLERLMLKYEKMYNNKDATEAVRYLARNGRVWFGKEK